MKIIVVHHFYKNGAASGENTIVRAQIEALERNGHEVVLIGRHSTETIKSTFSKIKVGLSWASNTGNNPWGVIKLIKPDLIIVHNLYPGFTSRWLLNNDFPKIYWLHNYRFFCIAASFIYKNQECLICSKSISHKALIRRCADNSFYKSLSSYLRMKLNRNLPEQTKMDYWVALSPKAKNLFLKTSIEPKKIRVIANFVSPNHVSTNVEENRWIFVGRLTADKGILALARNLPSWIDLDIYGDGPVRRDLETLCQTRSNIKLKGDLEHSKLIELLPNYTGAFVPSLGVEGIPTTFLEFAAAGLPVIGWIMNSTSTFIDRYESGLVLKNFDSSAISEAAESIINQRNRFSTNSLNMWRSEFSEEIWIDQVNQLFNSVCSNTK